jgi:hypothetical protein
VHQRGIDVVDARAHVLELGQGLVRRFHSR